MAFCSNCGAEIAEGAKFCPSCGTAVNGQAVSVAADTNLQVSERESSLNELSKMLEYFSKKKDLYERLKINQIYTKIEWGHGKKPKKIAAKWILFAAIPYILCLFCIASLIILIIASMHLEEGFEIWDYAEAILWAAGFGFLGTLIVRIGKKKKTRKLEQLAQEYDQLRQELQDYYNAYTNCPIGIEYTHPDDIENILDIVRSGRATRISDAINVIIDDIHKEKVEQSAREAARNSAEAAYLARKASKNASKAADSASRAEWNSYWR